MELIGESCLSSGYLAVIRNEKLVDNVLDLRFGDFYFSVYEVEIFLVGTTNNQSCRAYAGPHKYLSSRTPLSYPAECKTSGTVFLNDTMRMFNLYLTGG